MQTKILPSRQALVDRIELQYAYGNNSICLISEVGIGKSYLSESFISEKFTEHNKAYVKATRGMQDRHVMGLILEQSFSSPLIDYELSILENFAILSKGELAQQLIVLDDAHFVSDELLIDLLNLTKQYPSKVKILLTSTRQLPIAGVINIYIESLTQDESLALMKMYYRELPYQEEPIFNAFLQASKGNPQMLLSWQPENSKQAMVLERRSTQFTIYKYLLLLALLIMAIATTIYYLYPQTIGLTDKSEQSIKTVIASENVASENVATENVATENVASENVASEKGISENVTIDKEETVQTLALSQEATDDFVQQAQPQEQVQQAQLEEQEQQAQLEEQEQQTQSQEQEQQEQSEEQEQQAQPEQQLEKSEQAELEQSPQQDNAWFLSQKPTSYVLQLMLASSLSTIEKDIAKHNIENTHIFVIKNNNAIMFGLTYGQFSSFSDAQKAINNLPDKLQERGVFAKEMAKIQQQITANN